MAEPVMRFRLMSCLRLVFVPLCIFILTISKTSTWRRQDKVTLTNCTENSSCRWPPTTVNETDHWEGGFDISICVRPTVNALMNDENKVYGMRQLFRGSIPWHRVSFKDLATLPKKLWMSVNYPTIYQTYPQDVPLRQIVRDIKAGNPVSYVPKYNFPIRLLATSKSVCHAGSKHDLVLIIKSSILRWHTRNVFRDFMRLERERCPNLTVGYVFSLGIPRKRGGRLFNRDGHVMNLTGLDGDQLEAFEGKADEVMERIHEEIATHDDIVLADYEDTYFNLTFKSITNFRWMSAFCGSDNVQLFMTMDDDHRVNLSMVDEFMQRVPMEIRRNSLFGYVATYDMANRSPGKRRYLSYREVPWDRMCPYLRGFAQIIGPGVVDDMAIGTAYTRHNYAPEDVFLGLVAHKLQIPILDEKSMFDHDLYEEVNKERRPAMVALHRYFR
ncbi:unnamed protein product [Hydatigera taeniaeformis]|uniref:Hexosyltransferase n=1 Tax=Hydatigena taeniaeformis TaxID=6205 RepID=A0A0R3WLA6_HYDTA|nr:unnamed protein product [Hydatigera taeniaeformis]